MPLALALDDPASWLAPDLAQAVNPGRLFPPGSPWTEDVSKAPVDSESAAVIAGLAAAGFLACQAKILHRARGIPAWRVDSIPWMLGISGVAPNVSVMALRFIKDNGQGTTAEDRDQQHGPDQAGQSRQQHPGADQGTRTDDPFPVAHKRRAWHNGPYRPVDPHRPVPTLSGSRTAPCPG